MKPLLTIIGLSSKARYGPDIEKSYVGLKCFVYGEDNNLVQLVDPNTGRNIPGEVHWKDNFIYEQEEDKEYLSLLEQL